MKLNPFRRKTSGYFDKIKADYAERTRELEGLRREVAEENCVRRCAASAF